MLYDDEMTSRSRGWCFTLNNPTATCTDVLNELECRYLVYGREVGESGTEHLQGYVEFANAKPLGGVKKVLERAHWECRKGTPEEASQYCKKDGDFVERGEMLKQGKRSDLEVMASLVLGGASTAEVAQEAPATFVRFHRGLEALKASQYSHRTERPCVVWLFGACGSGKTRETVDCKSFYIKDGTQWWDGYTQQSRIVIDDFNGKWPFRDLLRLLDRYPYQGQTKGGYVKINSPEIYITADRSPSEFWSGHELAQIERRLTRCTEVRAQK